jgi:hypothetical protein
MIPRSRAAVYFRSLEFDGHTLELRKHGLRIKLSGQPMQVLAMLLVAFAMVSSLALMTAFDIACLRRQLAGKIGEVCAAGADLSTMP